MPYPLKAIGDNYVFLDPDDDCNAAALALEEYAYSEDFCIAWSFNSNFIARLMAAGFLVMSELISLPEENPAPGETVREIPVLLPRHHLIRSCLFFHDLHIKKSIVSKLSHYELHFDTDFDLILKKCLKIHGKGWLTDALVKAIRKIKSKVAPEAKPVSFSLYREGKLKAGEFGVIVNRVYTSYSGYFEEKNAGTVQMILTAKYLEKNGFSFWDLGMPLDYKLTLGAKEISRKEFMDYFFSE